MANVERIVIVGGGIAGLTLAAAPHRRGFRPDLVERSPAWRALRALSVADDVEVLLAAFEQRRQAPVGWVERQCRGVVETVLLPPAIRDAALRERGDPAMRERFRPLFAEP